MCSLTTLLKTVLVFHFFHFSTSIDTITVKHSIKDGDAIVSQGKKFKLGFFSPGKSLNRYVGIWYCLGSEQTVVWVANRDRPISGNSGLLSINSQGNLILYEGNQSTVPVWSTDVSVTSMNNSVAQLLDSGNLVLAQNGSKKMLWQSFDYPTHTMLPFMKLGFNRRAGLESFLTSWKSLDDPGTGNYSYRIDPMGFPQLSLYKGSKKRWRTGSWTGQRWSGVSETFLNYIFNVTFVNNEDEVSIMWGVIDPSILTRMVVNETGMQQRLTWNSRENRWIPFWAAPKEQCDNYNYCGANSNCNPYHPYQPECTCLPGYEPKHPQDWYLRDWSGGCKRKYGMSTCQRGEGFVKVARVKVPDTSVTRVDTSLGLEACEIKCLSNCSCIAYTSAYYQSNGGIGCLTYHGDMMDTRTFTNQGQDLYVRVNATELALHAKDDSLKKKDIVAIVMSSFVAILLLLALVSWVFLRKRRGKSRSSNFTHSFTSSTFVDDSLSRKEQDGDRTNIDLPLFDLSTIAAATDNFSTENKLGEGGFGSVYKGVLQNGREIAVKRLSKYSGQGILEFKNEVSLIAKLQHKNLVSLLGYCTEKTEKMLIYEFMPNKSLDYFIFDQSRKRLLDWRKRFDIILEVARGILYLHQDSRLKIIHRDLKASNILLDGEMKPKISDFGIAKIFREDETQANTNRVVGTYGYMSLEYILDGVFSTKSDIFSFGVIVLEIISGKKNGSLCHDDPYSSLIQHIWELWRDGKALEIVDSCLIDSFLANEVLRCIQVGLLCVQDKPKDRPSLSSIVFMLSNETILPSPKKSTFVIRKNEHDSSISVTKSCSTNDMANTTLYAR